MLENPIKREALKGTSAILASNAGTPLAAALAVGLGIAVEALGYLGEKRTRELFDTQDFVSSVIAEVQKSDDFAGFVYDIWLRHNVESSEVRRKRLKAVLSHAVSTKSTDYENFTRIITVAQQISDKQILILKVFYDVATTNADNLEPGSQSLSGRPNPEFTISVHKLSELLEEKGFEVIRNGSDSIIAILNQLSYFGLIGMYIAMDGEYYMPSIFGQVFLQYIMD